MVKRIVLIVSLIVVAVLSYFTGRAYQANSDIKIGKKLTIVIQKNEIIDYTKILEPKKSVDGGSYPWFDMISDEDGQKLTQFLKNKGFKIKSGRYEINQANSFEDIIKTLSFEPITERDRNIYKPKTDKQWDLLNNNNFEFFKKLTQDVTIESLMNKELYFYCKKCRYLIPVDPASPDTCYCGLLNKIVHDGKIVVKDINDNILVYKRIN